MRWCTFNAGRMKKYLFLSVLLFAGIVSVTAQGKHERKIERYKSNWNKLIPRYQKLQYAGQMGLVSLGTGWDYGRKKQWETDVFLGYLPKFDGDNGHVTITLKQNYIPWKFVIRKSRWMGEPLTVSLYLNKIFGDEFWSREPDKYPDGYYTVATNTRFNLAFGQRITFKLKPVGLAERLTLFYELGTNDLYVISYFTNKYLGFTDIFSLSLGIKFQFL